MHRLGVLRVAVALACLAQGAIGGAQVRDADVRDAAAEAAAKQALETFITEWNTADDANLRRAMHCPFVSVADGGADYRPST